MNNGEALLIRIKDKEEQRAARMPSRMAPLILLIMSTLISRKSRTASTTAGSFRLPMRTGAPGTAQGDDARFIQADKGKEQADACHKGYLEVQGNRPYLNNAGAEQIFVVQQQTPISGISSML